MLFLLSNPVYLSFGMESFFWNSSSYYFPTLTGFIGWHILAFLLQSSLFGNSAYHSPWYRYMMNDYWSSPTCSLKVHVSQMYLATEMLRMRFPACSQSSRVYCLGPLPPLCQWAPSRIPCPWNMTAVLVSSVRLPGPAYARVLGKPSLPLWQASTASVS